MIDRYPARILMLGATGTAGQATVGALVAAGHDVVCVVRNAKRAKSMLHKDVRVIETDTKDSDTLTKTISQVEAEALVSCLASRTGAPQDAWAVDFSMHALALQAAKAVGLKHMVLMSAICVQRPRLAFQLAKRAFESELIASGVTYSIVRPTALFKSLSGQIERVRGGRSFMLFGDGLGTACKPISDRDLGRYMAGCLADKSRWNKILPIGGPGAAITPREQGEFLFESLDLPPKFTHVPIWAMSGIVNTLSVLGKTSATLAAKAEFARIGQYYATESMLVWDNAAQRYSAEATPSTGSETLFDHYRRLVETGQKMNLREHAIF